MTLDTEFNSIRPYHGKEIEEAIERLKQSEGFLSVFEKMSPLSRDQIIAFMTGIKTRDDFQERFFGPFIDLLIQQSTEGVDIDNTDTLSPDQSYVFITNHRDIILDSAILNVLLRKRGLRYTRAAIGSNLLINDWVTDVVKLNSCFVIERDISVRQMLESSSQRSKYLRHVIQDTRNSVWIAQREGRTKNGDDKTQNSLLKMLKMSGSTNFAENFMELHLAPTSISYEWEPCDDLKTAELYKRIISDYEKTPEDDMRSMLHGMVSKKGRVHYHVEQVTPEQLIEIGEKYTTNGDRIEALSSLIDGMIRKNYKLWPNNYIAYDLVNSTNKFSGKYTQEEKDLFISQMQDKIDKLDGNVSMLNSIYLDIYSNPVKNALKYED